MPQKFSRRTFITTAGMAIASTAIVKPSHSSEGNEYRKGNDKKMRIGSDTDKLFEVKGKGAIVTLDYLKQHGFEGAFYRTMLDISPTLDTGELKEIKAHADSLGLYIDGGVGWVNPYNTAERPEIRRFGNGDYRLAMEKMIKAAREIDCKELYAVSGHSIHGNPYFIAYDRFRTDVSWDDQLTAMKKFIKLLAPMLKDLGLRINLETHGDETSFELLRIIEEIGPDIVGVTLDPGNLPLSGDVPMSAIKRLAPYVHCTHCKDGVLYKTNEGIVQQIRTVGQGVVDWEAAIEVLGKHNPGLHLSMEDYRAENLIRFYDPVWRKYFPDLTDNDIKAFERLADDCDEKINQGRLLGIEEFKKLPWTNNDRLNSYKEGASYLRKIINKKNMGRQ